MERSLATLKTPRSSSVEVICKINFLKMIEELYRTKLTIFETVLDVVPTSPFLHRTKNIKESELPDADLMTQGHLEDYAKTMANATWHHLNNNRYPRFSDYYLMVLHPHHAILIDNEVLVFIKELRWYFGKNIELAENPNSEHTYFLVRGKKHEYSNNKLRLYRANPRAR